MFVIDPFGKIYVYIPSKNMEYTVVFLGLVGTMPGTEAWGRRVDSLA